MGRQSSLKISRKLQPQKEQEEPGLKVVKTNYLPAVLLFSAALLTFLAYVRSLYAPLILDDSRYIVSQKLRSIADYLSLSSRSIAKVSFALNYHFSGMSLAAFRITNILFHILSAFLVFYLTYTTLNLPSLADRYRRSEDNRTSLLIAVFAATLFALHPIQTSAVNYVTQRMAVMAGMFSFAGVILYVKGAVNTGMKSLCCYAFCVLFFILAVFSKENAVMVLPMLMIYDFVFLSSFRWSEFRKRFIPIAGVGIILGASTAYYLGTGRYIGKIATIFSDPYKPIVNFGWAGMDIHWTPVEYILTELRVVSRYIFLILVPLPSYMVFDYSNAYPVSRDLFHPVTTVLSLFFIASIIFLSLRYIRKFPLISFGLIWYLVTISLESFIAIGLDPYFEHRNYLPSYGLFLALASLLVYTERRRITIKKEVIIPIAALLLFVLTFARNGTWSEGTLFWEDVVKKVPNSARGHLSLGFAYRTSGLADKAIEEYQTALRLKPDYAKARFDLGNAYMASGLADKAIEEYQATLRLKPDYAKAHNNLGLVYMSRGLTDKAAEQYRIALDLDPDYSEARSHLDDIYSPRGQSERTAEQYLRALRINPNNAEAHYALGNIFFKNKRLDEAIEHYRLSVKLKPDFVVAQYNLGVAYSYKGLRDKAIEQYRIVLKSDPGHAEARENLGIAYAEKGLIDKAIEHLKIAAALNPQNPTFRDNLTRAYQMKNPEKGTGTATRR